MRYLMIRHFVYGPNPTEYDENDKVVLYDSKEKAEQSLEEYKDDIQYAFEQGHRGDNNTDDVTIEECTVVGDIIYCLHHQFHMDRENNE